MLRLVHHVNAHNLHFLFVYFFKKRNGLKRISLLHLRKEKFTNGSVDVSNIGFVILSEFIFLCSVGFGGGVVVLTIISYDWDYQLKD